MTFRQPLLLFAGILIAMQIGCTWGLRQDYVYERDMVYSPDDPFVRGDVYKTHIGHDGHYYNCDDEEQKRYAPWIQWRQRPCDSQSCRREINELFNSYDRAICRWKMGSCQICPPRNFPPGAGYGNEEALAAGYSPSNADTAAYGVDPTSDGISGAKETAPEAVQPIKPLFGLTPSGPTPIDKY